MDSIAKMTFLFAERLREELIKEAEARPLTPSKLPRRRHKSYKSRDWNREVQELFPDGIFVVTKDAIMQAAEIARDFSACAESYAR